MNEQEVVAQQTRQGGENTREYEYSMPLVCVYMCVQTCAQVFALHIERRVLLAYKEERRREKERENEEK